MLFKRVKQNSHGLVSFVVHKDDRVRKKRGCPLAPIVNVKKLQIISLSHVCDCTARTYKSGKDGFNNLNNKRFPIKFHNLCHFICFNNFLQFDRLATFYICHCLDQTYHFVFVGIVDGFVWRNIGTFAHYIYVMYCVVFR